MHTVKGILKEYFGFFGLHQLVYLIAPHPFLLHHHSHTHTPLAPHLVLGIHLGHHAVLQQVEGEHLQHVQLVGHLVINGRRAADHVLPGGGGRGGETWD